MNRQKAPALVIGLSKEAVVAARSAITDILQYDQPPEVLIAALHTLRDMCAISNVSISNCHFEV